MQTNKQILVQPLSKLLFDVSDSRHISAQLLHPAPNKYVFVVRKEVKTTIKLPLENWHRSRILKSLAVSLESPKTSVSHVDPTQTS